MVRLDSTEIVPSPSSRCHTMGRLFAQSKDTSYGHVREHSVQSGPGDGVVFLSVVVRIEGIAGSGAS